MMNYVEFNTREKAEKCLKTLGQRGWRVWAFEYNGIQLGKFYVYYFTL